MTEAAALAHRSVLQIPGNLLPRGSIMILWHHARLPAGPFTCRSLLRSKHYSKHHNVIKSSKHIYLIDRLGMAADDALNSLIVRREMRKLKARSNISDIEAVIELTKRVRVEIPTHTAPAPVAAAAPAVAPMTSAENLVAATAVAPPHSSAGTASAPSAPSAATKPRATKPHQGGVGGGGGPHRKRAEREREAASPSGLERSSSLKRSRRSTGGKAGGKPAAGKTARYVERPPCTTEPSHVEPCQATP